MERGLEGGRVKIRNIHFSSILVIALIVMATLQPAVALMDMEQTPERQSYMTPSALSALGLLEQVQASAKNNIKKTEVGGLINATANMTDTDSDGLPDRVEAMLGTDFNNSDSDFDNLDDYYEISIGLDPLEPDSNGDGLMDYFEVINVSLDADGDGFINAWDLDNDGDLVQDSLDLSPYSRTTFNDSFRFNIKTNGNPTYITFQLRPENPDHLRLPLQSWDWPYDTKGNMQDLDNSTEDVRVVPMLELDLNFVPNQSEVLDYGIVTSENRAYIPLVTVKDYGANVAFGGRMFYPESIPLNISMNATLVWLLQGVTDNRTASGIENESITLAKYKEAFMLTGLTIEEDYGVDGGIFYSDDINQTMATGFLLDYAFLWNNSASLYDMPREIENHNLTMESDIKSFIHRDEALSTITGNFTPSALDKLPGNQILPIISSLEYNFTSREMDELFSVDALVPGNQFDIDLRGEPIITTKTLKMTWYNTSTNSQADPESTLEKIKEWGGTMGLSGDSQDSLVNIAIVWEVGEYSVIRVGNEFKEFKVPEAATVKDKVGEFGNNLSQGLATSSLLVDMLRGMRTGVYIFITYKALKPGQKGFQALKSAFKSISNTNTRIMKAFNTASDVLGAVGLVVDITFSVFAFFSYVMAGGWETGTLQGSIYATAMIIYAVILFVIGTLGPVGAIIAAVIAIADLILGFFGYGFSDFLEWVVGKFYKVNQGTDVDLYPIDNSVEIIDIDDNGLDVGDRMEFRSMVNTTVTKTSYGTWGQVNESYIKPKYTLMWKNSYFANYSEYTDVVLYDPHHPSLKNITYEAVAWLQPVRPTINFGQAARYQVDYKIYSTEEKIEWDLRWHTYNKTQTGYDYTKIPTIYFDVFPDNIDDFIDWAHMVYKICIAGNQNWCIPMNMPPNPYPLDSDFDGLKDWEETGTSIHKWDSDGDGLSDKYELDIGTDPNHWDRDGDGLNDRMELFYGTNTTNWDTDGDGLSDHFEKTGWAITFNYNNQIFNTTVRSDPLNNDTDSDGLADQMEYYSNLNPRSKDTDGDGIYDAANPRLVPAIEFVTKWGQNGTGAGEFKTITDVGVDTGGYVYVLDHQSQRIQKFDSNGNYIKSWNTIGDGTYSLDDCTPLGINDNIKDFVYVAVFVDKPGDNDLAQIQKYDLHGNFIKSWGEFKLNCAPPFPNCGFSEFYTPTDVAVDSTGNYVYVSDVNGIIQLFNSNGAPLAKWGGVQYPYSLSVDGNGYVYVAEMMNSRIMKYNSIGVFIKSIPGYSSWKIESPQKFTTDSEGNILVSDWKNGRILRFDSNGLFQQTWGSKGNLDGQFVRPSGIAVGLDGYIYVADEVNNRIQKFNQTMVYYPPEIFDPKSDTDGDGLLNFNETTPWTVSFANSSGIYYAYPTSDPLVNDTDFDGLSDYIEFNYFTNPRDVDTDDDGLTDFVEWMLGTNIKGYDSEIDGLDDGLELNFGSDPWLNDTDFDGLLDYEEYYNYSSNPRNNDTDNDGLSDSLEVKFNSSPINPDTDGDQMPDGEEYNQSSDPRNPDTDGDGLEDGYEWLYGTNPLSNDTDSDGVSDFEEIENRMDPLSNDTDGDGLGDLAEIMKGTDPTNCDTRGIGLNDSQNPYSYTSNVDRIWVAYDNDSETEKFILKLGRYTNLSIFKAGDLWNYSNSSRILLVGRPRPENNTVGKIIYDVLNQSNNSPAGIEVSSFERFNMADDVWHTPQTVVMLSRPYPNDHFKVLDMFKSLNQTIEYPEPINFLTFNTMKEMDCIVWIDMKDSVKPVIKMRPYNISTVPYNPMSGLLAGEIPVGKYLDINVSKNMQNESGSNLNYALMAVYYTAADLDRTGDRDSNDPGDIQENALGMIWYNEPTGAWERLNNDMAWVYGVGVNTTDFNLSGKRYEGYVWANVSHLSIYGLSSTGDVGSSSEGGITEHQIEIVDASIPGKIIAGEKYQLNIKISSKSKESGALLSFSKLPGPWVQESVNTGILFPGLNDIEIELHVPEDALPGRYEITTEISAIDFSSRDGYTIFIDIEDAEEIITEPAKPTPPEKLEPESEQIIEGDQIPLSEEDLTKNQENPEERTGAPLPFIPFLLVLITILAAGLYYWRLRKDK